MAHIKLTGVMKAYGQTQVIKGVDIDIKDGEFGVFVSPRAAANPPCCE